MKVILSKHCLTLAGMLEHDLGYHLVRRKNGFFARRNSKGHIPPDGHWRFIVLCAELAQNGLHISDIRITGVEINKALCEAKWGSPLIFPFWWYNAKQVLEFRNYNRILLPPKEAYEASC